MGIGCAAVKSEFTTQVKRLDILSSQISQKSFSKKFILYTAPEQLREIEEEVRRIVNRCHVFKDKFNARIDEVWGICDYIEGDLNALYESLGETIRVNAHILSETCSADLREEIDAIRAVYASHDGARCFKPSPELTNNLEQAEKLLSTHPSSSEKIPIPKS